MKTRIELLSSKLSKMTFSILMLMAFLAFSNLSYAQNNDDGIDWELQQKKLEKDFSKLKDNVDDTFDDVKKKFGANDSKSKETMEELNTELEKLGKEIEVAMEKSENATEDTWNNVSKDLKKSYAELEAKIKDVQKDMKK